MKDNLLSFFKLLCFILLLPFIAVLVSVFYKQVLGLGQPVSLTLFLGAMFFVASYLFFYTFKEVFDFGQNLVGKILSFVKLIAGVAPLVFPIYAVFCSIIFLILKNLNVLGQYEPIGLMTIGFFWTMHVVLAAQQLREGEKSVVNGGYFFGFGLVLIFLIIIAALLLAMVTNDFSLANFTNKITHQTTGHYTAIYKFLFSSPS